jgi:hypothetical protein
MTTDRQEMTPETFAGMGGGRIAYVRPLKGVEARGMFPSLPEIADTLDLWALLGADGTPIMVADSREAVVMNARENDLDAMSIQ